MTTTETTPEPTSQANPAILAALKELRKELGRLSALLDVEERHAADDDGLPTRCPDWCSSGPQGHKQALDEGCSGEESRVHASGDVIGRTKMIHDEKFYWNVWLRSDPGPECQFFGFPFLELETRRRTEDAAVDRFLWRLDTGAARVLARQLIHFADQADLHS